MGIDEYLRDRLMPVEGAIPHLPGIEMYGDSIPAGTVGGDLFEYINFQQRYDIDARIRSAVASSEELLRPNPPSASKCNAVDDFMEWLSHGLTIGSSRKLSTGKFGVWRECALPRTWRAFTIQPASCWWMRKGTE